MWPLRDYGAQYSVDRMRMGALGRDIPTNIVLCSDRRDTCQARNALCHSLDQPHHPGPSLLNQLKRIRIAIDKPPDRSHRGAHLRVITSNRLDQGQKSQEPSKKMQKSAHISPLPLEHTAQSRHPIGTT